MRSCNRLHAMALRTALAAAVLLLAARTQQAGCPDGFSGVGCRECIKQCNMSTTCSCKGRCRGKDGTCICDEGWTDAACSIPTSVTTPPPTMGCPDGFSSVGCCACEEDTYSGGCDKQCDEHTTCSGNGRCRGSDGTCICDEGWTGAVCSIPTSVTTPPQSTGCPDGFSGVGCQTCEGDTSSDGLHVGDKQCDEHTTCSGNGRCRGSDGTCICDEGWTGAHCADPDEPSQQCSEGFSGVGCQACDEDNYSGGCEETCDADINCRGSGIRMSSSICNTLSSFSSTFYSYDASCQSFSVYMFLALSCPVSSQLADAFLMLSSAEFSRVHVLLCTWHVFLHTFFGLFFHTCRPSKQPRMVGSTLGVYSFWQIFVSARTNKRHHHLKGIYLFHTLYYKQ
jgi:hypothetical protein